MTDPGSGVLRMLSEVVQAIRFHGPEKTSQILYGSRAALLQLEDPDVIQVLNVVSLHVNIPISELLGGKGRKNNRCFAVGLCAWYLKHEFKYESPAINKNLNMNRVSVWKYLKDVEKLNPIKNSDKALCAIKIKCDQDIAAYKKAKIVF